MSLVLNISVFYMAMSLLMPPNYEGGSICNENPIITPSIAALEFYGIYQQANNKGIDQTARMRRLVCIEDRFPYVEAHLPFVGEQ